MFMFLLDLAIVMTALVASALWLRASGARVRRISKYEEFDYADYNRLVTALNRSQILNGRAALATGIATALAAARLAMLEVAP